MTGGDLLRRPSLLLLAALCAAAITPSAALASDPGPAISWITPRSDFSFDGTQNLHLPLAATASGTGISEVYFTILKPGQIGFGDVVGAGPSFQNGYFNTYDYEIPCDAPAGGYKITGRVNAANGTAATPVIHATKVGVGTAGCADSHFTYYVSPSGDDDNDGLSPATAWKTVQRAVDAALAGDTVHVLQSSTGTTTHYDEYVSFPRDGTAANPIDIDFEYTKPSDAVGQWSDTVLDGILEEGSYTNISDVTVQDPDAGSNRDCLEFRPGISNDSVSGLSHGTHDAPDSDERLAGDPDHPFAGDFWTCSAYAVYYDGPDSDFGVDQDISVSHLPIGQIVRIAPGPTQALGVSDVIMFADHSSFTDSEIVGTPGGHPAIHAWGDDDTFDSNYAHDFDSSTSNYPVNFLRTFNDVVNGYTEPALDDAEIAYNQFRGVKVHGHFLTTDGAISSLSNLDIHDNLITGVAEGTLVLGGGLHNVRVAYNTFVGNGDACPTSCAEIAGFSPAATGGIYDNIFEDASGPSGVHPWIVPAGVAHDYNLAHGAGKTVLGSGGDAHGIDADPLFADPESNWRLQAGSPAIDAGDNGTITAARTQDVYGHAPVGAPDRGAYENTG
jgi:hypothetical protein